MSNRELTERDGDGNITKMERYDAEGNLIFTHTSQWQDGRIIRKSSYDRQGNLTACFDYAYDERGNNTEGTWFVYNNGILMKAEFVYDENDRMIERTHLGTGNIATNKTYQQFNEEGQLIRSVYYGAWPDCAPVYTDYEYDENGFNVRTTTRDENQQIQHYEILTPNQFGKVAEYTSYDGEDKPVYTIRYHYDDQGNRIKQERYDGEGNLVSSNR